MEPGRIELMDLPEPDLDDDGLVVHVRAASICGTDLKISRNGHFKLPAGQRRVLGHEFAGEVMEVGVGQQGFAVGDRVAVAPNVGCGMCRQCRAGDANMCADYDAFGITLDGGFEERLHVPGFAVHRGNVFRIPHGVGYAEAALVEPFSCCYRGQRQISVGFEDTVLVMGAGPIGIFHLLLAKLAGAGKVIASDLAPHRLEAARGFGADVVVDASSTDLAEVVMAETGGKGADAIVIAASSPALQGRAVELLAVNGRVNFLRWSGRRDDRPDRHESGPLPQPHPDRHDRVEQRRLPRVDAPRGRGANEPLAARDGPVPHRGDRRGDGVCRVGGRTQGGHRVRRAGRVRRRKP